MPITCHLMLQLTTLKAVRQDEGLELEVTDPEEEQGQGLAGKTEGKEELKLERLQGR
jgi:hypothetical protein